MGMYDRYNARYAPELNRLLHQQALAENEQEPEQEPGLGGGAGEIASAFGGQPEAPGGGVPMSTPGFQEGPGETYPLPPEPQFTATEMPGSRPAFSPPDPSGGAGAGALPDGGSGAMGGNPDTTLGEGGGKGPAENLTMEQVWREGTSSEQNKIIEKFEDSGIDIELQADAAAVKDPQTAAKYTPKGKTYADLTKQEKAGFLLEFGLRLMQASASVETTGLGDAVSQAGLGTLGSMREKLGADTEAARAAEQTAYDRGQDTIDQGEDQSAIAQKNRELEMQRRRDEIAGKGANYTGKTAEMDGQSYDQVYTEDGGTEWIPAETAEGGAFRPDAPQARAQGPYASEVERKAYVEAKAVIADPNADPKAKADAESTIEFMENKWNVPYETGRLRQSAQTRVEKMLTNDYMDTILPGLREANPEMGELEIRELLIQNSLDGMPTEGLPPEIQREIDEVSGGGSAGRQGAFGPR